MTLAMVSLGALEAFHQLYFRRRCRGLRGTTPAPRGWQLPAGAFGGVAGAALLGLILSTAGGAGPQLALMTPILFLYILSIAKGRVLAEPIVWPDLFLASQILRNPTIYHLPLGTAGSCTALALAITGLVVLLHQLQLLATLVVAVAILMGVWAALSLSLAGPLKRWKDPIETRLLNLPHWGCHSLSFPLSLMLQGAMLNRARPCRPRSITRIEAPSQLPPLLLMLQLESFCDPDRFQPAGPSELRSDLRAVLDRLRRRSSQWGALTVPSFGANTVRAEYTVITAEPLQAQGLRGLNPYQHRPAAGQPGAIAQLRAAGVKTTFFHANTGRFFNRIQVLPGLGFSRLVFAEDWPIEATARRYASDREIERFLLSRIVPELDADQPQLVFAASIEAHSPYTPSQAWGDTPEQVWQRHTLNSLTMLEDLLDQLDTLPHPVGVCVFGDHRPPLPSAEGSGQSTTDYLLINSGGSSGEEPGRAGACEAVSSPCAMEASELLPRFIELQLQASPGPGPTVSASPSHQRTP